MNHKQLLFECSNFPDC